MTRKESSCRSHQESARVPIEDGHNNEKLRDDVFGLSCRAIPIGIWSGQELPAWRRCAATEALPKHSTLFRRGSVTIEPTFNVGRSGSTLESWPALHLRSSTKMRCEQGYGPNVYVALFLQ